MPEKQFLYSEIVGKGDLNIRLLQILSLLTCKIVHVSSRETLHDLSYIALSYV